MKYCKIIEFCQSRIGSVLVIEQQEIKQGIAQLQISSRLPSPAIS